MKSADELEGCSSTLTETLHIYSSCNRVTMSKHLKSNLIENIKFLITVNLTLPACAPRSLLERHRLLFP